MSQRLTQRRHPQVGSQSSFSLGLPLNINPPPQPPNGGRGEIPPAASKGQHGPVLSPASRGIHPTASCFPLAANLPRRPSLRVGSGYQKPVECHELAVLSLLPCEHLLYLLPQFPRGGSYACPTQLRRGPGCTQDSPAGSGRATGRRWFPACSSAAWYPMQLPRNPPPRLAPSTPPMPLVGEQSRPEDPSTPPLPWDVGFPVCTAASHPPPLRHSPRDELFFHPTSAALGRDLREARRSGKKTPQRPVPRLFSFCGFHRRPPLTLPAPPGLRQGGGVAIPCWLPSGKV